MNGVDLAWLKFAVAALLVVFANAMVAPDDLMNVCMKIVSM